MPGPKPNPNSGRSKRRGVKAVPATGKLPRCPSSLGAAGRELWQRIVKGLEDRRALGSLHGYSLMQACKLADEIDSLETNIAENGMTDCGPNGIEYLRPHVKQLNTARRQMQFYEKEFGLTAAADERLRGAPENKDEDDPLDMVRNLKAIG